MDVDHLKEEEYNNNLKFEIQNLKFKNEIQISNLKSQISNLKNYGKIYWTKN